jgi:hypothetical protein
MVVRDISSRKSEGGGKRLLGRAWNLAGIHLDLVLSVIQVDVG